MWGKERGLTKRLEIEPRFEIHVTRQRARAGNSTICYLDNTVLPTEIESVIKLLGSKKAHGPDKIRNEMKKAGNCPLQII